jgi:hypothetical protein
MYLEFLLLIFDYFRTQNKRNIYFEVILPLILSLLIFGSIRLNNSEICLDGHQGNFISLLGVLIGFSITAITLLITSNNENIENLKKHDSGYSIGRNKLSLFDILVTNFSYLLVTEIFLVICNLFFPALNSFIGISFAAKLILFSIDCGILIHILLVNLRNICDLYFTLISKKRA